MAYPPEALVGDEDVRPPYGGSLASNTTGSPNRSKSSAVRLGG